MTTKKKIRCPYCQEEILLTDLHCPHCGEKTFISFAKIEIELTQIYAKEEKDDAAAVPEIGPEDKEIPQKNKIAPVKINFALKLFIIIVSFAILYMTITTIKQRNEIKKLIASAQQALRYNDCERALQIANFLLTKYPDSERGIELKHSIRNKYMKIAEEKLDGGYYKDAIHYFKKAQEIEYTEQAARLLEKSKTRLNIKKINSLWENEGIKKDYILLFSDALKLQLYGKRYKANKVLAYANFNTKHTIPSLNSSVNYWSSKFHIFLERFPDGNNLYIKNNKLVIETKKNNRSYWPKTRIKHGNFVVRFDMEYLSGHTYYGAGFWFRADQDQSKRFYTIFNKSGSYDVGYYDNNKGKWIDLKGWTSTNLFFHSPNSIGLMVINNYIQIYINGSYITTVYGIDNRKGTYVGFVVGTDHMKYAFDNFCMLSLKNL